MMELIMIENGTPVLDRQVSAQIADFERQMNLLKDQEDRLKKMILKEMEEKGIIGIVTDDLTITYVPSYDREKFKSKEFKANHRDLYDDYVSMTNVKASIRIKPKEKGE